jgi:hypothetical protein
MIFRIARVRLFAILAGLFFRARNTRICSHSSTPRNKTNVRKIAASGAKANKTAALERTEGLRPQIEFALKAGASLRKAAKSLNERGIESPGGGRWHAPSLLKAARRLGLR